MWIAWWECIYVCAGAHRDQRSTYDVVLQVLTALIIEAESIAWPETDVFGYVAIYLAPGIWLSLHPHHWDYKHVPPHTCFFFNMDSGHPSQVFNFSWKILDWLSHLPSHRVTFNQYLTKWMKRFPPWGNGHKNHIVIHIPGYFQNGKIYIISKISKKQRWVFKGSAKENLDKDTRCWFEQHYGK